MYGLIFCTFIAGLCIYWFFNSKNLTKRLEVAPTVTATVIDCIRIEEADEAPYYKIIYEYSYDGIIYKFEELNERKKTIGKEYKKLVLTYQTKDPILVDHKILKENKESKGTFLLIFAVIVELLGIFGFILEKYEDLGNLILYNFLIPVTGIIFVIIGIVFLTNAIRKRNLLKLKDTITIPGTIIGYDKRTNYDDSSTKYSYFPIYECILDGEKVEFTSTYSAGRKNKGTKVNLYFNKKNGEIFEKENIKTDLIIGFTFGILGLLATISSIIAFSN